MIFMHKRIRVVIADDHELFSGNKIMLYKGFAMAILRSSQTAGNVKLKVKAAGLKGVEQTLVTK